MTISPAVFPDRSDILPIHSAGYSGAEDVSEADPGTLLDVPCWVQEARARPGAETDVRGPVIATSVYYPDTEAIRGVLRGIDSDSVVRVTRRNGVLLDPDSTPNLKVVRAEFDAVGALGLWRVDSTSKA